MTEDISRFVAHKVYIADVLGAPLLEGALQWKDRVLGRVNIIGTIISYQDKEAYRNVFIDDGTGSIALRIFDSAGTQFSVGETLHVLGRPRAFGQEKYVSPESIRKIDQRWLLIRKREINVLNKYLPIAQKKTSETATIPQLAEQKVELIKQFDKGEGVDVEFLLSHGIQEELIHSLIREGVIFETKPGRVKVLE